MDSLENSKEGNATIEYVDSGMRAHNFIEKVGNKTLVFRVLKMKDSVFVYIGDAAGPQLMNMCLAMKSPYDTIPLTTHFLGLMNDDRSSGLASKLSTRLKKPVFVSVNVELDRFQYPELSLILNDEINNWPERF